MSVELRQKLIAKQERRVEIHHWTARLETLKAEKAEVKLREYEIDFEIEAVESQIRELNE